MAVRSAVSKTGKGTIIWFDLKAGYGFVKPADGGPDVFTRLPVKGEAMVLAVGDRVTYELLTSGKSAGRTEAVIRAKSI